MLTSNLQKAVFCHIADFPFSTKVTIQAIPNCVERSKATLTGTSRLVQFVNSEVPGESA